MSNSSLRPISSTLSGATSLGQSGPGCDGNEDVLCSPQRIMEASPSDCIQDTCWVSLTPLQRYSQCILLPQTTGHIYIYIYICEYTF